MIFFLLPFRFNVCAALYLSFCLVIVIKFADEININISVVP